MRDIVTLAYVLKTKWFMRQQDAEAYYPLILGMITNREAGVVMPLTDKPKESVLSASSNPLIYSISDFGLSNPPENAPENSVALLNLIGPITKYDAFCGGSGTETKENLFDRAMANPNIKGLIMYTDSGGGDGGATESLNTKILNAPKPVVAYVKGTAASAAYKIISSAHAIVMDGKTSEVGSIGSYVPFANFTEYYKKLGVDIRRIYAPQSDLKNKEYEDLFLGKDAAMKDYLEEYTNFFIESVKSNRGDKLSKNKDMFKGAMFFTEAAIAEGLADYMGDLDFAANLIDELAATDKFKSTTTHNSNSKQNMSIFGNKFQKLSALKDKKAEEITQADCDAANAELQEAGISAVITTSALTDGLVNTKTTELQTQLTTKTNELTAMTTERDNLKAQVAKIPGAGAVETTTTTTTEGTVKPEDSLSIKPENSAAKEGETKYNFKY